MVKCHIFVRFQLFIFNYLLAIYLLAFSNPNMSQYHHNMGKQYSEGEAGHSFFFLFWGGGGGIDDTVTKKSLDVVIPATLDTKLWQCNYATF